MIIRTKVLFSTSACSVFLVVSEEYYFALDVGKNKERNLGCRVLYTPPSGLAQLGERRSVEREVAGSNPGRTKTQGL